MLHGAERAQFAPVSELLIVHLLVKIEGEGRREREERECNRTLRGGDKKGDGDDD